MQIYTESSYNSPHSATNYGIFCLRFRKWQKLRTKNLRLSTKRGWFCSEPPQKPLPQHKKGVLLFYAPTKTGASAQKGGTFVLNSNIGRIEEIEFEKIAEQSTYFARTFLYLKTDRALLRF